MHTKYYLPVVAAALFALAGAAHAQAGATPQITDSVHVNLGASYHVSTQEAFDIEQSYRLSNGQKLTISQINKHFFGRLGDDREWQEKPAVEIFPTGPGQFITKKGSSFAFSNGGTQVSVDDAQFLPGMRMPADSRNASTADGSASIRLVSR